MKLLADSGSSKTDWVLVCDDLVIKQISTQGINPIHQPLDVINTILLDELLPHLGKDKNNIAEVWFYGSGCRPAEADMIKTVLSNILTSATFISVDNDLLGAARALCGHSAGVACILGTGANSCWYDGSKIIKNTPPLGYILGDEGSGAVMGKQFLNALLKGRLSGEIVKSFEQELSLSLSDVIYKVYKASLPNRFLASLCPFISRYKDEGAVHQLIVDNFCTFIINNINPYHCDNEYINAVGSIAYYFRNELVEAIQAQHYKVGKIVRSPINGLIEYHKK